MGDSVERSLEETVPILRAAKRAKLLSSQEIDHVVRQRRNYEYALKKQAPTRAHFLKYASFERELANLLQKRADKKKIKKKTVQLIVGKTSSRVNLVYSRAVKAFREDVDLWLHYARHCVKTGSIRTAQRVLARAIAYRGDCEQVWLAAVALHFDTCADAKGARTLAQRALRAVPNSATLWKEYFRLEVSYLSKLIIRRLAIGLPPAPEKSEEDTPHQSATNKGKPMGTITSREVPTDSSQENSFGSDGEREPRARDFIPDGQIVTVQQRERSESSESEDSEEESSSMINSSSSELSSDDGSDEGMKEREALSFWQGGVPMTVFRRACDKVSLTPELLLQFWMIAVSSPYVPPHLLASMSSYICKRFPEHVISRLIEARVEWDCARRGYERERVERSAKDSRNSESSSDMCSERARQVQDMSAKVPGVLGSVLCPNEISALSDSERSAAAECVRDLQAAFKEAAVSREVANELDGLQALLEGDRPDLEIEMSMQNDEHMESSWEKWSLATLEHAVAEGKSDDGKWRCGDVISAVKQKAGIPFRDIHHDRVVGQFLATETDVRAIREVTDLLLATPPLTLTGLRCMIAAEMRVFDATTADKAMPDDTKTRIRSLLAKCEALPGARHDIEFWLLFLDFERRKAKDARAASAVCAKALRILTKEKAAHFTELHTLRNLE